MDFSRPTIARFSRRWSAKTVRPNLDQSLEPRYDSPYLLLGGKVFVCNMLAKNR